MTDNEKRAHDLAIAETIVMAKTQLDDNDERQINFFEYYKNAYDNVLIQFHKNFPEQ